MQARNQAQEQQLYLRKYALDFRTGIAFIVAFHRNKGKLNKINKSFADSIEALMNGSQAVSLKYTVLKEMVDANKPSEFTSGNKAALLIDLRRGIETTDFNNLMQHDLDNAARLQADLQFEKQTLSKQVAQKEQKHTQILAQEKQALLEKIEELRILNGELSKTNDRLSECNSQLNNALFERDNSIQSITHEIKALMQLAHEQQTTQGLLENEITQLRTQKTPVKPFISPENFALPTGAHSPLMFKHRSEQPAPMSNAVQTQSIHGKRF